MKDFAGECTADPYGLHTGIPLRILFTSPVSEMIAWLIDAGTRQF
ncbi:MAG: hypothetical protein ACLTCQ_06285 [Enterocloster bolteae]